MVGASESCEELGVNRGEAEKSSSEAVVPQVPRVAQVTLAMNAKLASLDEQRQQLKEIMRGYGKRKRQIKVSTSALFRKAKKLKEGEIEIIADIKGIAVPWDDDDEENQAQQTSSSSASTPLAT